MKTHFLIDNMAPTNGRLIFWILTAMATVVIGELPYLKPFHSEIIAPFLGGVILATALASWTLDAQERKEEAAMTMFWGPFTEGVRIVLPSFEPKLTDVNESSPFTLYHDAVASYAIQTFLQSKYGAKTTVISSKQIASVAQIADEHLILIGGPNFNDLTKIFMKELWTKYQGDLFHWSSTLLDDPSLKHIVQHPEDHLVKVTYGSGPTFVISDTILDVPDANTNLPSEARGMFIRAEGVLKDEKMVLVLAGVDTAFGTLAAARYVLDVSNLINTPSGAVTQVIVSARVDGYNIGRSCGLRMIQIPQFRPQSMAARA